MQNIFQEDNTQHTLTKQVIDMVNRIISERPVTVIETPGYGTCEATISLLAKRAKMGYILVTCDRGAYELWRKLGLCRRNRHACILATNRSYGLIKPKTIEPYIILSQSIDTIAQIIKPYRMHLIIKSIS